MADAYQPSGGGHPADKARIYSQTQIGTASHARLVCLLHEHCAGTLRHALGVDPPQRRALLDRAQNILVLLQRSLKLDDTTANGLFHLYDYCYCLCEHDAQAELTNAYMIIDGLYRTFDKLQKRPYSRNVQG